MGGDLIPKFNYLLKKKKIIHALFAIQHCV